GPDAISVAVSGLVSGAVLASAIPGDALAKLGWMFLGAVTGLIASWLPTFVAAYIEEVSSPELPVCANGKCKPGNTFREGDFTPVFATEKHVGYIHTYIS